LIVRSITTMRMTHAWLQSPSAPLRTPTLKLSADHRKRVIYLVAGSCKRQSAFVKRIHRRFVSSHFDFAYNINMLHQERYTRLVPLNEAITVLTSTGSRTLYLRNMSTSEVILDFLVHAKGDAHSMAPVHPEGPMVYNLIMGSADSLPLDGEIEALGSK